MGKKRIWGLAAGFIALAAVCMPGFPNSREEGAIRYVGVPDGAAGLIARYVLKEKMGRAAIETVPFESYTLYDCCAGATQYALGSGRLDMAIMCPDAAQSLVAKDRRFEIAGPVMMNSDILITRPGDVPGEAEIAVSQKRSVQRQMVFLRFGGRADRCPCCIRPFPLPTPEAWSAQPWWISPRLTAWRGPLAGPPKMAGISAPMSWSTKNRYGAPNDIDGSWRYTAGPSGKWMMRRSC